MTRAYNKPPLTFDDQLNLLIGRGLSTSDRDKAKHNLECISYYRLSAYWYPFRVRDGSGKITDQIRPGTTFEKVLELYEFDRQLRLLIIDAIDRVEISIRTQLTYRLAHQYGAFAHIDPKNFHPRFNHTKWLNDIQPEILRSREEFIRHYQREYSGFPTIPIWMLTEVMTLGSLSKLYEGLNNEDKKPIAQYFGVHHKALADWLHTLTYIRNICAHHGRLWNRELSIKPERPNHVNWQAPITPANDRIYFVLLMLRHLLRQIAQGDRWHIFCDSLIDPIAANPFWRNAMGMPDNWKSHPIWA